MGNVVSSASAREHTTGDVIISESETMNYSPGVSRDAEENENIEEQFYDAATEDEARAKAKEEEMNEFRKQLSIKREQRKEILARHRSEKEELEKTLEIERKSKLELYENNKLLRELLINNNIEIPENLQSSKEDSDFTDAINRMKEEFEILKSNNNKLRRDLAETNSALQNAYSEIADLNAQNIESIKQIHALKEVVTVSKTMINLREEQLNELKNKLSEIEQSLADRETNMLSNDLRQEYERQLQNIRTLRGLYEERARLAEVTRQSLARELEEQRVLNQAEINKCQELTAKVEELEAKVEKLNETIENKNDQILSSEEETRGLKSEMTVVNKLFSQVLLGYKTKQDLDKLAHRLEENHGLLTHMAERENGSEASSALPKLLLELVSQVDEGEDNKDSNIQHKNEVNNESSVQEEKFIDETEIPSTTAEEIIENLPKVWRVLMELLSHQSVADVNSSPEKITTCYKSVESNSGPVLVPSVSQTYIRLKDLIIEKLALIKEVNRMKQLNGHLETRLEEQERRLCLVTSELSKTWHVVSKLRRHHHQLHTHEKILKYELQQKRKLLNELKEELEYCRDKWEQAREKNTQSEKDWRKLRAEFSSRKTKPSSPSFNNSAESGYSDERPSDDSSDSTDESEYVTEPLVRCKKKIKKSFETILDSSTDFNLAAEREDPASDMLDVADLPLDTQDCDDNQEASVSDNCNSDNLHKSEKVCDETEDEICDITNDSCIEESSTTEHYCDNDYCCVGSTSGKDCVTDENTENSQKKDNLSKLNTNSSLKSSNKTGEHSVPMIDPAAILRNIKEQNERLAKKDKKLEKLEKSGTSLLNKVQATAKYSETINKTLDHLLTRPTSSRQTDVILCKNKPEIGAGNGTTGLPEIDSEVKKTRNQKEIMTNNEEKPNSLEQSCKEAATNISTLEASDRMIQKLESIDINQDEISLTTMGELDNTAVQHSVELSNTQIKLGRTELSTSLPSTSQGHTIDPKSILESIKQQNERLAKKDQRLLNLEKSCSEVVQNISNTLSSGDEIIKKLDSLHKEHKNEVSDEDNSTLSESSVKEEDNEHRSINASEPSTSSDIDHEAIFAARDIRLKKLEEQTKSLVNKVNKTTSKGVKIHYKLEELHNIYGSESSRAGTPSEDNEDRPQRSEDESSDG